MKWPDRVSWLDMVDKSPDKPCGYFVVWRVMNIMRFRIDRDTWLIGPFGRPSDNQNIWDVYFSVVADELEKLERSDEVAH